MMRIVRNCSHASSLFSAISSYFYTASHTTSRFTVIRCVGEAISCWKMDILRAKQNEMIALVLSGLCDRSVEVRESSRIIFCLLYCRFLPSIPSLYGLDDLDDFQGNALHDE